MDTKILLNKATSKESVNTSNGINIKFSGNRKLLPLNDVANTINQYEQYLDERKKCNKIRLTCQVNPICSNVLFNKVTEIVFNEGSDDTIVLNYCGKDGMKFGWVKGKTNEFKWNEYEAVRDTQLSVSGNCTYHCGLDIFNNHLLRSKTFKVICRLGNESNNDAKKYEKFNTIEDMMRNVKGEQLQETIVYPLNAGVSENQKTIDMHVYEYDDILTYKDAVNTKLITTFDGWVGFENTSKIKTYDDFSKGDKDNELPIERPIMYMNAGDFVDMYPSRDLYSFVPKYNRYRNRMEKNWNYCITYPSSSVTEGFENIIETYDGLNSLKAIKFDESTRSDNGSSQLVIYSISKHGLKKGDFVNIYKKTTYEKITYEDETAQNVEETEKIQEVIKILDNAEVQEVVDDFIFIVFSNVTISGQNEKSEIKDGKLVKTTILKLEVSYKKVVGDIECEYYVRIFSKLPNFKYASGDTSSEYQIYKDNAKMIDLYQSSEYEFSNHISRLAFAKNIYTDEVGQIVFTDDIDISNLRDNLGRPLSSIYITFIKNNKGYKEWYGFDGKSINVQSADIEYSHCFGKVTCGIEMVDDEIIDDKSDNEVRKLIQDCVKCECIHTIDNNHGFNVSKINPKNESTNNDENCKECEVSYYEDKHYYGDLCYYDNYNAIERSIQPILHRFNTAQRESIGSNSKDYFKEYKYDEIISDDYDANNEWSVNSGKVEHTNEIKEGYYYCPHYEIPIRTFDKLQSITPDFLDILSITTGETITINTMQRHYLSIGDKSVLFDRDNNKYYHLMAISGNNDNDYVFTAKVFDENGNPSTFSGEKQNCRLFKTDNLDIPSYAKVIKDGTCRLIWRNIVNNGLNKSDKTIEEYPFTNGAFYINKRIDIYVRRQDPYGVWGVYDTDDIKGVDIEIENEDNFYKENDITC